MQLVIALSHIDDIAVDSMLACSTCVNESLSLSLALLSVEIYYWIRIPKDSFKSINGGFVALVLEPISRNKILDFDLILSHVRIS